MGDRKNTLNIISISGGKDSTCLALKMIEKGLPIDAAIYADTGMDFPEMEEHILDLDEFLYRERGLHITKLRHPKGFEWLMFEEPKQKPSCLERREKAGVQPFGNGWPGPRVRWCTGQLKTHLISKEITRLKRGGRVVEHIGIAADEAWRCKDKRYPLVEWGVTETKALEYCYERGFTFGGLYEIYSRASCWCCPFQRLDSLRKLRKHHPELWARLLAMDHRAREQFGDTPLGTFRKGWTVERLDERFAGEDAGMSESRTV